MKFDLFGKFLKPSINMYKLHNYLVSIVIKWHIFATKYNKNPYLSFDLVEQKLKRTLLEKYTLLKNCKH